MPFGFNLSFAFLMGGGKEQSRSDDAILGQPRDTGDTRQRGRRSFSTAPISARQARKQREREHLADEESLHLLEAATATNSERARDLDRKSLAVLMQATKQRERERQGTDTPPEHWRYPIIHRLKGINSSPLSYSPPFTSPSRVESISTTPKSRSEIEEYHDKGATVNKSTKAGPEQTARDGLRATLAAAGWSSSSIDDVVKPQSDQRKSLVSSVYGWFDKLEERDAREEWEKSDQSSGEANGSPTPSTQREGAPSPLKSDRPSEKQQDRKETSTRGKLGLSHAKQGAKAEGNQDDDQAFDDDNDDGWVKVEDLGGSVRN